MIDLQKELNKLYEAFATPEFGEAQDRFEAVLAEVQKLLPKKREPKKYPNYAIRGGQAGCLVNGMLVSDGLQGCPIKAFLRSWGIEEPLSEKSRYTFANGKVQEEVFSQLHPDFQMGVYGETLHVEGVPTRTEIDAVAPDGTYYELKSIQSTSKLKPYLVDGEYSFDNLLQLATYMALYCNPNGILRYTCSLYHEATIDKVKHKFVPGTYREYRVTFDDQGVFSVDGVRTFLTTDSIYRFCEYMAWVFNSLPSPNEILIPKSSKDPQKTTCCFYCPFKEICEGARAENLTLLQLKDIAASQFGGGK